MTAVHRGSTCNVKPYLARGDAIHHEQRDEPPQQRLRTAAGSHCESRNYPADTTVAAVNHHHEAVASTVTDQRCRSVQQIDVAKPLCVTDRRRETRPPRQSRLMLSETKNIDEAIASHRCCRIHLLGLAKNQKRRCIRRRGKEAAVTATEVARLHCWRNHHRRSHEPESFPLTTKLLRVAHRWRNLRDRDRCSSSDANHNGAVPVMKMKALKEEGTPIEN